MDHPGQAQRLNLLRLRRIGIDTYLEPVIYMRSDCHVCRGEGFEAPSRVEVRPNGRSIIATLNVLTHGLLDYALHYVHAQPGVIDIHSDT